jgi:beta-glucanase (GH16 family)
VRSTLWKTSAGSPDIHGTIHGPGYSGDKGPSSSYSLANKKRFADSFHVFAIEWEPDVIRFYCDGVLYATRTPADLPDGKMWVYDHPFFIILNVAVGGGWPGNPDATTVFPQTMLVDYVRVYQRARIGHASSKGLLQPGVYAWEGKKDCFITRNGALVSLVFSPRRKRLG